MQLVNLADQPGHSVSAHGSQGFAIQHLAVAAKTSLARLVKGGAIGAHPAAEDQLLLLLEGAVTVTGEEGTPTNLLPAQGALWICGETHTTTAQADSVLLIIEGNGLAERVSRSANSVDCR